MTDGDASAPSAGSSSSSSAPATLFTVGHGTLGSDELVALLRGAGIELLVDVRSHPGSRRNPQFARAALEEWLPAAGVEYRWEPRLGGRRRLDPDSPHRALRNEQFRAYADHMETAEFGAALEEVLGEAGRRPAAVMCAESVWWRCHRRLLADAATLRFGVEVRHVMHDGRIRPHDPTDGARIVGDRVVYDLGEMPPLL